MYIFDYIRYSRWLTATQIWMVHPCAIPNLNHIQKIILDFDALSYTDHIVYQFCQIFFNASYSYWDHIQVLTNNTDHFPHITSLCRPCRSTQTGCLAQCTEHNTNSAMVGSNTTEATYSNNDFMALGKSPNCICVYSMMHTSGSLKLKFKLVVEHLKCRHFRHIFQHNNADNNHYVQLLTLLWAAVKV